MKKQKIETNFVFPGKFTKEGYRALALMVAIYYDNPKNLEEYEKERAAKAATAT